MLTLLASWLLASSPLPSSPVEQRPSDDCEDIRRLELSPPVLSPPRICVSPGTLTGVIFDHPVVVELQEEVRFVEVTRGRVSIAFMPPRDLRPGETLRLTAVLGVGETSANLTFVLVAHPGHGSHQIEVNYNQRSWQSMNDALSQALLANRRLSAENTTLVEEGTQMRAQLAQSTGLCGAYAGGQLTQKGITSRRIDVPPVPAVALGALKAASYRGDSNIAVEIMLTHQTPEPWSLEKATLVNERGETLNALRHRQVGPLPPGEKLPVFVEFDPTNFTLGKATLTLTGTGGRTLTLPKVVFP
ncbi:DUF2381 family protein [Cystobacter fuscus]|uniref:DUF2381 family protein n=1 Tax=Cystobacter fuscus TaxID=43 RepID=UPI002B2D9C6A|nr:DUF2381 family protein [Cystobacter fuscus]